MQSSTIIVVAAINPLQPDYLRSEPIATADSGSFWPVTVWEVI